MENQSTEIEKATIQIAEIILTEKEISTPTKKNKGTVKITPELKENIFTLLEKCNDKECGKLITAPQLIQAALNLLTDEHIQNLQDNSLTWSDKIDQEFKTFLANESNIDCKDISRDEFIAKRLKIQ